MRIIETSPHIPGLCAICAGPPYEGSFTSDETPEILDQRRRQVQLKRQAALQVGEPERHASSPVVDRGVSDDDNDRQYHHRRRCDRRDRRPTSGYDPSIMHRQYTLWLNQNRFFERLPDVDGRKTASLSLDYGTVSFPQTPEHVRYYRCHSRCINLERCKGPPSYVMHDSCMELLSRLYADSSDFNNFNKDVLFAAMTKLVNRPVDRSCFPRLNIDYGGISDPIGQRWRPKMGEEFSVMEPLYSQSVVAALQDRLSQDDMRLRPDTNTSQRQHDIIDPFLHLPDLVIRNICDFLGPDSLLSIRQASWPVYNSTYDNNFWKAKAQSIPWAWELPEAIAKYGAGHLDYKAVFMYLNFLTKYSYGMDPRFLVLGNRRRLWHTTSQIMSQYYKLLDRSVRKERESHIMENGTCAHLPYITSSEARGVAKSSLQTFFIYSWTELDDQHLPTTFEAYWDVKGALTGLAVVVSGQRRVFGAAYSTQPSLRKTPFHIEPGTWLQRLKLHSRPSQAFHGDASYSICGIEIILNNGEAEALGDCQGSRLQQLTVSPNHEIVGVTGEIDSSGIISRLGLLQCRGPGTDDDRSTVKQLPFEKRRLWACGQGADGKKRQWDRIIPLAIPDGLSSPALTDIAALETIFWGIKKNGRSQLQGVLLALQPDEQGRMALVGACNVYTKGSTEPMHPIGIFPDNNRDDASGTTVLGCHLNGPAGEFISSVSVSSPTGPRAIKFVTSKGKTFIAGDDSQDEWVSYDVQDGERIVGLAIAVAKKDYHKSHSVVAFLAVLIKNKNLRRKRKHGS